MRGPFFFSEKGSLAEFLISGFTCDVNGRKHRGSVLYLEEDIFRNCGKVILLLQDRGYVC